MHCLHCVLSLLVTIFHRHNCVLFNAHQAFGGGGGGGQENESGFMCVHVVGIRVHLAYT